MWKKESLFTTDDRILLEMAHTEGRIVITHDRDFGQFIYVEQFPFTGILYLRPGHLKPDFTITSLNYLLQEHLELSPPFIIVAENTGTKIKLRIRHFE